MGKGSINSIKGSMKEEMRIFDGVRGGLWLHMHGVVEKGEVAQVKIIARVWVA